MATSSHCGDPGPGEVAERLVPCALLALHHQELECFLRAAGRATRESSLRTMGRSAGRRGFRALGPPGLGRGRGVRGGILVEVGENAGQCSHLRRGREGQEGRHQSSELAQASDPHGKVEGQSVHPRAATWHSWRLDRGPLGRPSRRCRREHGQVRCQRLRRGLGWAPGARLEARGGGKGGGGGNWG